jgi:uncharacterized protein (DUF488 family)
VNPILTVGHSTHQLEHFLALLTRHNVTAVADVRSVPASRFTPQFNRDAITRALRDVGIQYVFLGDELGARSTDPDCYVAGQVRYGRLAKTRSFLNGIQRLLDGRDNQRIAVMCAEQEPLDCHRTVLVARVLVDHQVPVHHIHSDGQLESHDDAMARLMAGFGLDQPDLFHTRDELLNEALSRQEQRIAYVNPDPERTQAQT